MSRLHPEALMLKGAKAVHASATHAVLSGPALERINASPIVSLGVTDTIPLRKAARTSEKIVVISIAELVGEAIIRSHHGDSVTSLFV